MHAGSRSIWLRRGDLSSSGCYARGINWKFELSVIGHSAARETFVNGTPHMAAIWSDLFQSIVVPQQDLRWQENGPGVGRDARIAYSSLLGRYMARAYLTEREGVRDLVPLDVAKRRLQATRYEIRKDPPGKGLEADWIGLDAGGLVIVEAKGCYHDGAKVWSGPIGRPRTLKTAIDQVERTAIFDRRTGKRLPSKRWAIATRWGTQQSRRHSTLLASDPEEGRLPDNDYREISGIFRRADLDGVLTGMGYQGVAGGPDTIVPEVQIRAGGQILEPGLAAAIGPFGVRALRLRDDVTQFEGIRELNPNAAVASLSSRYMATVLSGESRVDTPAQHEELAVNSTFRRSVTRAGLTIVWLAAGDEVEFLTT